MPMGDKGTQFTQEGGEIGGSSISRSRRGSLVSPQRTSSLPCSADRALS